MDGHIIEIEHLSRFGRMFMSEFFYTTQDMVGKVGAFLEADESVDNVFVDYLSGLPSFGKSKTIYRINPKTGFTYSKCCTKFMEFAAIIDKQLEFIDTLAYMTNTNPLTVPYTDKAVIDLVIDKSGDTLGNSGLYGTNKLDYYMSKWAIKPETFYQLSKFIAFASGTRTLRNDNETKLYSGKIDINSIPTTRDDVFELFVNKTGDRESAFYASEQVRIGKPLSSNTKYDLKQYDCEEIKGILFLPPRHDSLIKARIACTQAYYKLSYPEEFYYAYFTCFASWAFSDEYNPSHNINSDSNEETSLHILTLKEMYKNGFDLSVISRKMFEKRENCIIGRGLE